MKGPLHGGGLAAAAWCAAVAFSMALGGCGDDSTSTSGSAGGTAAGPQRKLTLLAAASATDVMEQVIALFNAGTGITVQGSYGSSSTLARQIEAGAGADVFISASVQWVQYLEERGLAESGTAADVMFNELVVVTPADSALLAKRPESAAGFDLPGSIEGRLAVGDPAHVPAGVYAKQAMENLGWWEPMKDRLLTGSDVRNALLYVERGEAEAGIVYRTDAMASKAVSVLFAIPPDTHDAVSYPAVVVKGASPDAARFMDFLRSEAARRVLREAGFRVPES